MTHLSLSKLDDEVGRLAALRRYEILDSEAEAGFEEVIELAKGIFGTPMAAISLIDEDRQWFKASRGIEALETERSVAFCHHTIQDTAPMAVTDATQDPRFVFNPHVTAEGGVRSYLGAPLTTPEGYNVGTLCVIGTEPRNFTSTDEELLTNLSRLVVSLMELRTLARRDALTGVMSRRAFEEALRSAAAKAMSHGRSVTLLLADIDHFKLVNDRFGHPAGDLALKAVAEAMGRHLRRTDTLGRLGGEEFGVLLEDIGREAALALAERLRQAVAEERLLCLGGEAITISCGVSHWEPKHQSVVDWIAEADTALYAAKRAGRDRVELAGRQPGQLAQVTVPV